ncbi:hypothetical protein, partial [Rhodopirellula bahusiensis]
QGGDGNGTVQGAVNSGGRSGGGNGKDGDPKKPSLSDMIRQRIAPEEEAAPLPKNRKRPPSKGSGKKRR